MDMTKITRKERLPKTSSVSLSFFHVEQLESHPTLSFPLQFMSCHAANKQAAPFTLLTPTYLLIYRPPQSPQQVSIINPHTNKTTLLFSLSLYLRPRLISLHQISLGSLLVMEREMGGGGGDGGGLVSMFSDEELSEISGLRKERDYIEVTCGCTSNRYGDAVGKLRVFPSGDLEINCECTPGCQEDKLTPAAFEKHSERESAPKWKNNVWVISNGDKVGLSKTPLLKYYHQALKSNNGSHKSNKGRTCHRDEFVRCSKCNKVRRLHLRTKEECRIHHDALADPNWKCADLPYDKITCDDDEERASRMVYRGCHRAATCRGCTSCVCFGCNICRFSDCSCQTCIDFTRNAEA